MSLKTKLWFSHWFKSFSLQLQKYFEKSMISRKVSIRYVLMYRLMYTLLWAWPTETFVSSLCSSVALWKSMQAQVWVLTRRATRTKRTDAPRAWTATFRRYRATRALHQVRCHTVVPSTNYSIIVNKYYVWGWITSLQTRGHRAAA